jgi:hypothetical protein
MLQLKIDCDSASDARVYLNAQQYLCLITDLAEALRQAKKHGTDADVVKVVETFMPALYNCVDNDWPY